MIILHSYSSIYISLQYIHVYFARDYVQMEELMSMVYSDCQEVFDAHCTHEPTDGRDQACCGKKWEKKAGATVHDGRVRSVSSYIPYTSISSILFPYTYSLPLIRVYTSFFFLLSLLNFP